MSLAVQILHKGCDYIAALLAELELEIAELSWFSAYLKVKEAERVLVRQLHAVQTVIARRLSQLPDNEASTAKHALQVHASLHNKMGSLVQAVHDREDHRARCELHRLIPHMRSALGECAKLLAAIEERTGDLSRELGQEILRPPEK